MNAPTGTHEDRQLRQRSLRRLRLDEDRDGHVDTVTDRPENPVLDDAEDERYHDPDNRGRAVEVESGDEPLDVTSVGARSHALRSTTVGDALGTSGFFPQQLLPRDRTRRRAVIVNTQLVAPDVVLFNKFAWTDLIAHKSPSVLVPILNSGDWLFMQNAALDGTNTIQLEYSLDGGVTFSTIGAPAAIGAGTSFPLANAGVGFAGRLQNVVIRASIISAPANTTGTLTVILQQQPVIGGGIPVYLVNTKAGMDPQGNGQGAFLLPPGEPIEVQGSDELWGYCATGQYAGVSVLQDRNSG